MTKSDGWVLDGCNPGMYIYDRPFEQLRINSFRCSAPRPSSIEDLKIKVECQREFADAEARGEDMETYGICKYSEEHRPEQKRMQAAERKYLSDLRAEQGEPGAMGVPDDIE